MGQGTEPVENGRSEEHHTEFEDAINLTGTGKFHNILLFTCGIGLIGVMMEIFGTSFLLPSAECDFNLSSTDKGLLNALFPIGTICGSHMWGYIADTKGRKTALVASFTLDGLCAIISSFIPIFSVFLIFRFLCGFFVAGASSVIYAYLGEFHTLERRNKGLMWLSVFIGLGICIQPGIAWLIMPQPWEWHLPWCVYKSWRFFIIVCAIPCLLCALIMTLYLPETPKFLMTVGKKEEALKVLKYIYKNNSSKSADKYPVKSIVLEEDGASQTPFSGNVSSVLELVVQMWDQTVPLFKPPFLWKTLLACFVQYGLYASANGLSLWLPDIFNHQAAYFAKYPGAQVSTCQIYNTVQSSVQLPNTSHPTDTTLLRLLKPSVMDLHENYSFAIICEENTVMINVSNFTEIPIQQAPDTVECLNGTLIYSVNESSLQIDFHNGIVFLTVLNTSDSSNLFQYEIGENNFESVELKKTDCNVNVDISAYQNTLIIGATNAASLILVGFLIGPLGKKPIIMVCLICGGITGILLDYINANWEYFVMALAFVTLSGMCIPVVVSVVVEIFPTNLRAMAVSLSLMCGRLGSFTAHMLMGTLLETNCLLMTYLMGGLCTCCGIISFLLPEQKKAKK